MLKSWLISTFLSAVAIIVTAQLFESFYIEGFGTALLASIILGVFNTIVRPILILFTLPITFLTLGLFLLVINAITLMLTQAVMGSSFIIEGFGIAIVASIILSLLNMLLNKLVKDTVKTSK